MTGPTGPTSPTGPEPPTSTGLVGAQLGRRPVEIARNRLVAGVLGICAAAVAIAFLSRAVGRGGALDWGFFVILALVARIYLGNLVDARSPLLIADEDGVRLRLGGQWRGLPWEEVGEVEVRPRRHRWSDGRLVVVPRDLERTLEGLDTRGRRQATLNLKWYGAALVVPLGMTTLSSPGVSELAGRIALLSRHRTEVVEPLLGGHHARVDAAAATPPVPAPTRPITAPVLGRPTRRALRAEVTRAAPATTVGAVALAWHPLDGRLPEEVELRRPADVDPLLGLAPVPSDPVIGPELAAARARLDLSVDELADRTRIRPHVIEAIEVDDFASCGGDFYARGHLRTLARVLGTDAAPLIAAYDCRYATAPIDARRVFEAELAHGMSGGIRGTVGGTRWGALAGVVLTLLLVWGLVRLFASQPPELIRPAPIVLDGSAGVSHRYPNLHASATRPVPVVLTVSRTTQVVVRDASGDRVMRALLVAGSIRHLRVPAPVTIRATDAGAVSVSVAGAPKGFVGPDGVSGRRTFHRPVHPHG